MIYRAKKRDISSHGFTFIELMIVIAIMGIAATAAVMSMDSARSEAALQSATRQVTSAIRLAQSYALQGKMENGSPVCGFGVKIDSSNKYEIYYDALKSSSIDCGSQTDNSTATDSSYVLPSQVSFDSNSVANSTAVYFQAPGANPSGTWNSGAAVYLIYSTDGHQKEIMVNNGVATVQ